MKPFLGSCPDDKTDALVAHATLHPIIDDDTESGLSRLLVWVGGGVLGGIVLGTAAVKVTPHVVSC